MFTMAQHTNAIVLVFCEYSFPNLVQCSRLSWLELMLPMGATLGQFWKTSTGMQTPMQSYRVPTRKLERTTGVLLNGSR